MFYLPVQYLNVIFNIDLLGRGSNKSFSKKKKLIDPVGYNRTVQFNVRQTLHKRQLLVKARKLVGRNL